MSNESVLSNAIPSNFRHLPTFKRWIMSNLAKIHHGKLFVYLDGNCYVCGNDDSLTATLRIHKPFKMARRAMTKGDLGFAESYLEGEWSSDDLTRLLKLLLKNRSKLGKNYGGKSLLRTGTNLFHKLRRNSLKGSRKNIEAHYDLGNEFYQLWLDEGMTYSAALFTGKSAQKWGGVKNTTFSTDNYEHSLKIAQDNKYQRILQQLDAKHGESILEVGFGWGGFAEKALQHGCHVHGITLSNEQLAHAQKRLAQFGDQANLEIKDYRMVEQQYDHIVSIEMFEAVGEDYWQTYFEMLKRSLKPGGSIVLQIITIKDEYFDLYKRRADFIQRYIFPGGMLPSESKLEKLIKNNQLQAVNRINFGHDYGETLARWEQKFLSVIPQLEAMGYDERFQRMWHYYLAYCQAGFEEQRIDVLQLTLKHQ